MLLISKNGVCVLKKKVKPAVVLEMLFFQLYFAHLVSVSFPYTEFSSHLFIFLFNFFITYLDKD